VTGQRQHIAWIKFLIDTEGFAIRDLLTAPRARPSARERRRRQIAEMLYRCGLSAHDLVTPTAPVSHSLLFIAKFENGHETCTAVLGAPDKPGLQRGIRLAQRAFTWLRKQPPPRIVAARFEMNGKELARYDADAIASPVTDSELPNANAMSGAATPSLPQKKRGNTRSDLDDEIPF
jgi:hypothetical protein